MVEEKQLKVHTITSDNGTEFADHEKIAKRADFKSQWRADLKNELRAVGKSNTLFGMRFM